MGCYKKRRATNGSSNKLPTGLLIQYVPCEGETRRKERRKTRKRDLASALSQGQRAFREGLFNTCFLSHSQKLSSDVTIVTFNLTSFDM